MFTLSPAKYQKLSDKMKMVYCELLLKNQTTEAGFKKVMAEVEMLEKKIKEKI